MKKIIILIGIIILGSAAWYLGSPLFISNEVNEEFPEFQLPPPEELAQMSQEELDEIEAMSMEAAKNMPDKVMTEAMPAEVGPISLATGQFQDADNFHRGEGTATIYELPGGKQLLRFEDFSVTNGPDLHVLLVKHPSPQNREDLGSDYLDLGQLKGNIGNQNYEIPEGVNIADYGSIMIYCEPFHVIFSTASLSQ